jgi:hypothetical protein
MNWTELLRPEMEAAYRTTECLVDLVDPATLAWGPSSGQNWMTVGQLLRHIGNACGHEMKGFVTGDWGPPAEMSSDSSLPPADRMPTVGSVAEARKILAADRKLAFEMLATAGDKRLDQEPAPAPWDATPMPLGRRLLEVVYHLETHKCQLFYYLKLQGKPVHTGHLWGL